MGKLTQRELELRAMREARFNPHVVGERIAAAKPSAELLKVLGRGAAPTERVLAPAPKVVEVRPPSKETTFDRKKYQREYMREYMKKRRALAK